MDSRSVDKLLRARIVRARVTKMLSLAAVGLAAAGAVFGGWKLIERIPSEPIEAAVPSASPVETEPPQAPAAEIAETEHTLQAVWFGEGERPESIKLAILHQDELIVEAELKEEGNWRFSWSDGFSAGDLRLAGDFPENISAEVSVSGENFTVSCTVTGALPPPTEAPVTPTETPAEGNLPETGLTVYPIVLMICLGAVLTALGMAELTKSRENKG